jgi:hypothetical protein
MDAVKVAILGCGPTGLLAAHGVRMAGEAMGRPVEVQIFSNKRKSPLYGCQYLHGSIPGLELPSQRVSYQLLGDVDTYRKKVYGGDEDVAVSPELLSKAHTAWDIRAAYDQLWKMYEPSVVDYFFSIGSWRLLRRQLAEEQFQLTFTALPAPVLCTDTTKAICTFESQPVWAMGDAPDLGRFAEVPVGVQARTVVCNGLPGDPWYRASRVFGHATVEWPVDATPPHGASRVLKPLSTTCACNRGVIRLGRYGLWQKGVLAHSAFLSALAETSRVLAR